MLLMKLHQFDLEETWSQSVLLEPYEHPSFLRTHLPTKIVVLGRYKITRQWLTEVAAAV